MPDLAKHSTVGEAIRAHAARDPSLPAIVASGCSDLTYGQLVDQFDRVGEALRAAGKTGDARIAIAVAEPVRAALAVVSVIDSAIAVPIDMNLTGPEIERRLKLVQADAIVLAAGVQSHARAAAERTDVPILEVEPGSHASLKFSLSAGKAVEAARAEAWARTVAFILQTSGTSAEPNLVPYSNSNMLATAARVQRWFALGPEDRCLSVSPVHYCHGLTVTVLVPLLSGGSVAFPKSASRVDIAEWFDELKPTWLSAGPTLHLALLDRLRAEPRPSRPGRLKFVVSGGAPLPPAVQSALEPALGVPVLEHYGATEAAQISANLPSPGGRKAGTCGRPDTGTVRIVDGEGRSVPAGEAGEILVGGATVAAGYLNAPELNARLFADGWFHTGDLGVLDAEGFLSLRGRVKDIINRGGEKVSPQEVDEALTSHPGIAEAAAYAVPHPRLGEDVAAAVVLRPGASLTAENLREFLGERLAWFKVPRRIDFVDALPRGHTGKVQRRKLSGAPRA